MSMGVQLGLGLVDLSQMNVRRGKPYPFTMEGTAPHISLFDEISKSWVSLGKLVQKLVGQFDWEQTSDPLVCNFGNLKVQSSCEAGDS